LKVQLSNRNVLQRAFGGIKLFEEPKEENLLTKGSWGGLVPADNDATEKRVLKDLHSRTDALNRKLEEKEIQISSLLKTQQQMAYKYRLMEDELEGKRSSQRKCDFYTTEIEALKTENKELNRTLHDCLLENSGLIKTINTHNLKVLPIPSVLTTSDETPLKEPFITHLLKDNASLRKKLNSIEPPKSLIFEESKRYEKKRTKKALEKASNSEDDSEYFMTSAKENMLEKRKKELEAEVVQWRTKYEEIKLQLESDNKVLLERLNSLGANYQELQSYFQLERKDHFTSVVQEENNQLRTQNTIIQAQIDDAKIKFRDLESEKEVYQKSAEYYLTQLKESREEFQSMLNLYSEAQKKLAEFDSPSLKNDNPHAIQIKKFELKVEGLELINKQLINSVADSNRILRTIEQTCLAQINKMEETLKSTIKSIFHKNISQDQSIIGTRSAEELLVENAGLKSSIEEYSACIDEMKTSICTLTNSIEETRCKLDVKYIDDRQKEKELFLKIIKDFEKQRGGNLEELEVRLAENTTFKAKIEKLEEENEKLKKRFEVAQSQLTTTNKVLNEQIKKKKEMLEVSKQNNSKINALTRQVDESQKRFAEAMGQLNESEIKHENQDLHLQVNGLKKINEKVIQEKEVLIKENAFLKQNLSAISVSRGEEAAQLQIINEEELKEVREKEAKEVQDLHEMINKCIDTIMKSSEIKKMLKESSKQDAVLVSACQMKLFMNIFNL
jgi:hypothetical protein